MYSTYQHPPLHLQTTAPSSQYHQQHTYTESPISAMSAHPTNAVPSSPSGQAERQDEELAKLPGPPPTCHLWEGLLWTLEIVQHPQRARMCGFGDKDRRPISPPPCIRVVIMDPETRQEIDYRHIELSHLVLTVDIFDAAGSRELNLVKQSNASPCISSSTTSSFPTPESKPPPPHEMAYAYTLTAPYPHHTGTTATPSSATSPYYQSASRSPFNHVAQSGPQSGQHPPQPPPFSPNNSGHPYGQNQYQYTDSRFTAQIQPRQPPPPAMSAPAGGHVDSSYANGSNPSQSVYTRNLIGNLSASAFRLVDETDKLGVWFVLQDLSVRTEGWFRLKVNFFNLAKTVERQIAAQIGQSPIEENSGGSNIADTTAPCLASAFSMPFKVFSAKKFPGVVESTELSRKFADQGIKIPIRKEKDGEEKGEKRSRAEVSDEEVE